MFSRWIFGLSRVLKKIDKAAINGKLHDSGPRREARFCGFLSHENCMCLILHSRAHLTVKLLQEQIWPHFERDGKSGALKLSFLECYDFIVRSHAKEAISHLFILSPHSPSGKHGIFKLKRHEEITFCDWGVRGSGGATGGPITVKAGELSYRVTRLSPKLSRPEGLQTNFQAGTALGTTGMTVLIVTFEEGELVQPFDRNNPSATTYWIRLAFCPNVLHRPTEPMKFGQPGGCPALLLRTCSIYSPNLVVERLDSELELLAAGGPTADGAKDARKMLLDDLFKSKRTSTRIEDHRITLVTSPDFLVMNMMAEGACTFMGIEHVAADEKSHIARTWLTGAAYDATNDALFMAKLVYRYLREWARNPKDAKTKEAITSAVAPNNHANVSHVVESLRGLGFLQEHSEWKGYYWIKEPMIEDGKLFLGDSGPQQELDLGARDGEIRAALYGSIPVAVEGRTETSRFVQRGLKIHYDLAFHEKS